MSLKGSFVEEKVIDNTGLYDALGIEQTATTFEVRMAYEEKISKFP